MNRHESELVEADRRQNPRLVHYRLTQVILGAFYTVHTQLGHGSLEPVYANAIAFLLRRAGLRVEREVPFEIVFHGETMGGIAPTSSSRRA